MTKKLTLASSIVVCLTAASAVTLQGWDLFWRLQIPGNVPDVPVVDWDAGHVSIEKKDPVVSAQLIHAQKWFGQYVEPTVELEVPEPPPPVAQPLKPSTLSIEQLVLRGVLAAGVPEQGSAVISVRGRAPELYRVNESLEDGAVLKAVYADSVALELSGTGRSILYFPDQAPTKTNVGTHTDESSIASPVHRPIEVDMAKSANSNEVTARAVIPVVGATTASKPGSRLQKKPQSSSTVERRTEFGMDESLQNLHPVLIRSVQEAKDDPQAILNRYGIAPDSEGYRLTSNLSPLLKTIGLQPGDIITHANGRPIGNPAHDKHRIDALLAGDEVQFRLRRDGASYSFVRRIPRL